MYIPKNHGISSHWWFGDPNPLLYTSKSLYSRVQWFLGIFINLYTYIYREPVCPPFWASFSLPPKKAPLPRFKTRVKGFQVYINIIHTSFFKPSPGLIPQMLSVTSRHVFRPQISGWWVNPYITVDGWNPAPVDRYINIPTSTVFTHFHWCNSFIPWNQQQCWMLWGDIMVLKTKDLTILRL